MNMKRYKHSRCRSVLPPWAAMGGVSMIPAMLLMKLLSNLSFQEIREIYGFTKLELPWVAIELLIHAMLVRRMMNFQVPEDLQCLELFAGNQMSSQIAKAFTELGFVALAFDILRYLDWVIWIHTLLSIYTLFSDLFVADMTHHCKFQFLVFSIYLDLPL